MWWFPWGNGSNPHKTPTTQPISFIFVAMIFFSDKDCIPFKYPRLVQWVIWYEEFGKKWGSRRGQLGMCPITCTIQAQGVINRVLHLGAMLRKCKLWGPYSGNISKVPPFQSSVDHLCMFIYTIHGCHIYNSWVPIYNSWVEMVPETRSGIQHGQCWLDLWELPA